MIHLHKGHQHLTGTSVCKASSPPTALAFAPLQTGWKSLGFFLIDGCKQRAKCGVLKVMGLLEWTPHKEHQWKQRPGFPLTEPLQVQR